MVVLGLLFILLGAIAIGIAVVTGAGAANTAELMTVEFSALTIFLFGVAAGALILWGFTLVKYGTKKSLQQRKERKKLTELSAKLDEVQAERRSDATDPTSNDR